MAYDFDTQRYPLSEMWYCECGDLNHVSRSHCDHCKRVRPLDRSEVFSIGLATGILFGSIFTLVLQVVR